MRTRANGRTALLLVILAALGIALGAVSLEFSPGLFGLMHQRGKLVVKVLVNAGPSGTDVPVANASVVIDAGNGGRNSLSLLTNSSGEVQVELPTGNHSLLVYNSQFGTGGEVPIVNNKTTLADVYENRYVVKPAYVGLSDEDNTGYVSPWEEISVAVNSSSADLLLYSSAVFLDATYLSTTSDVTASSSASTTTTSSSTTTTASPSPQTFEVKALLFSAPTLNSSANGLTWISWQPTSTLPIRGLSTLTLDTYSAMMQVEILGGR